MCGLIFFTDSPALFTLKVVTRPVTAKAIITPNLIQYFPFVSEPEEAGHKLYVNVGIL